MAPVPGPISKRARALVDFTCSKVASTIESMTFWSRKKCWPYARLRLDAGIGSFRVLSEFRRSERIQRQVVEPSQGMILAEAKSNRAELGNGADIFRRLIEPAQFRQLSNEMLVT